jgi:hypothetical protein
MFIGLVVGAIDYAAGGSMQALVSFNTEVFTLILLPLIIFGKST